MNIIFYGVVTISAILCLSIFEWMLHRFVMHRPVRRFQYPFKRHVLIHHRIFGADETYHLARKKDKGTIIRMAWWNEPVLVIVFLLPSAALSILLGMWSVLTIFAVVSVVYFCAYEYMHWCMHLPKTKRRLIERWRIFKLLNGHHLIHHRYQQRNFNVVLPVADWLFRTLRMS